jgi:hypothetical protein
VGGAGVKVAVGGAGVKVAVGGSGVKVGVGGSGVGVSVGSGVGVSVGIGVLVGVGVIVGVGVQSGVGVKVGRGVLVGAEVVVGSTAKRWANPCGRPHPRPTATKTAPDKRSAANLLVMTFASSFLLKLRTCKETSSDFLCLEPGFLRVRARIGSYSFTVPE